MKLDLYRSWIASAVGAFALVGVAAHAAPAEEFPNKPLRIIVAAAAGSSPDIVARLVGQRLSDRLGQPVVVENRPGAATNIGTEAVVKARPDGYTLLLVTNAQAINATLYPNLGYNFLRDIKPVASLVRLPLVMLTSRSVKANTVPELIQYAKAHPGELRLASSGTGTVSSVAGLLFTMMTGTDMLYVPYRSGPPALTDLSGGHTDVMFETLPSAMSSINSGRVRPLAVTTAERVQALPDIPPLASFVPGYEASTSFGLGIPSKTPVAAIARLNKEVNAVLADPKMRARIAEIGGTGLALPSDEYGRLIAAETEKWGKVVKAAGLKPE